MAGLLEFFRPSEFAASISEIDIAALSARGFEAVMLDLDNTLLPWKSCEVPESSKAWVESAKRTGMQVCIVSNTHNPRRLAKIGEDLGIVCLARALKPRGAGFARAANMVGCDPARGVVIGDQLLTDVLGGNLAGMHTILVRPMHRREFVGTKLSRLVERLIFALLRGNSKEGTIVVPIKSEEQDTK